MDAFRTGESVPQIVKVVNPHALGTDPEDPTLCESCAPSVWVVANAA